MARALTLKPSVYKQDDCWVAQLDHYSWAETEDFDTWNLAMDHAIWMWACAND